MTQTSGAGEGVAASAASVSRLLTERAAGEARRALRRRRRRGRF